MAAAKTMMSSVAATSTGRGTVAASAAVVAGGAEAPTAGELSLLFDHEAATISAMPMLLQLRRTLMLS